MTYKSVLLGLSTISAIVLAGTAQAQMTMPMPAMPPKPAVPPVSAPAPAAPSTGTDVSGTANAAASFAIGTVVKDSTGAQIGTVMDPKEGMATEGRVAIKTSSGFLTVPAASLRMDGDVAVSSQTAADIGAAPR